mmetsp:Transcript_24162/g.50608  ORF Transcript_24162/g.50608 Transcript_24162/m.50608 type:complete len:179 (-) Transcript_24162:161-697(-)
MKEFTALLVILFAAIFQLTTATQSPTHGYNLNKRIKGAWKPSPINQLKEESSSGQQHKLSNARQWKEEDYEALMNAFSQNSLRGNNHRQLQQNNNDPYTMQQTTTPVARWQKIVLAVIVTVTVLMALYVCALRRELSYLNEYLPLGFKLFPDADTPLSPDAEGEEGERAGATSVVEMS